MSYIYMNEFTVVALGENISVVSEDRSQVCLNSREKEVVQKQTEDNKMGINSHSLYWLSTVVYYFKSLFVYCMYMTSKNKISKMFQCDLMNLLVIFSSVGWLVGWLVASVGVKGWVMVTKLSRSLAVSN